MSLPLNWMVLLFFLFIALVIFIILSINSKFKWRMNASELEEEVERLNKRLNSSPDIEYDFIETIKGIKEKLTLRQFEIFIHIVEGLSSKEIAKIINLSPITIDSHVKEIVKKLNVKKRSQLGALFFDKLKERIGLDSFSEI